MQSDGRIAFLILLLIGLCYNPAAGGDRVPASDTTAKINERLALGWATREVQPAEPCSDRVFARRVYLDLAGRIPTAAELSGFLDDDHKQKRSRLIDALLQSDDHASHFASMFDALLMGRTDETGYAERTRRGWRDYLERVFRDNRPWNKVAAEMLVARPEEADSEGSVWFLYERKNDYQAIAEAIAPAFFGIRIECAQCHDHMLVDEIKQQDYWGLVAFFNRGKNKESGGQPRVAESAIGGFSEFANLSGDSSPNHLTFLGSEIIPEDRPGKDEKETDADDLYVDSETESEPRVPKFSRREQFVTNVMQEHPLLARAMVNRLWAILMGRGLVHPFNELDSVHPPSHPELLDWLSDDFRSSGYDIRRMVRAITNSAAYQLESIRPSEAAAEESFAWYLQRPLTAEQYARSVDVAIHGEITSDDSTIKGFRQQFRDVLPEQIDVTIADALFLSNGKSLEQALNASVSENTLIARAASEKTHKKRAKRLIREVFGRRPNQDETKAIVTYLRERPDRTEAALRQVAWSLLTSAEFRFNH